MNAKEQILELVNFLVCDPACWINNRGTYEKQLDDLLESYATTNPTSLPTEEEIKKEAESRYLSGKSRVVDGKRSAFLNAIHWYKWAISQQQIGEHCQTCNGSGSGVIPDTNCSECNGEGMSQDKSHEFR